MGENLAGATLLRRAARGSVQAGLLFLMAGWAQPARAQMVEGRIIDARSAAPLEGVLVLLSDVSGATRAEYLTDGEGRFFLRAPAEGSYFLRAEGIGFRTIEAEDVTLVRGEMPTLHLSMQRSRGLEDLRAGEEPACIVGPGSGPATALAWEEARKALTILDWSDRQGDLRLDVSRWEKDLVPQSQVVLSETRQIGVGLYRNAVPTAPLDELLEGGFNRPDPEGGLAYYGPDASVLLSGPFLQSHCFRLSEDDEDPGLLGLSFEPVPGTGPQGIRGTLWLDRETAQLQYLHFEYLWSPWPEAEGVAEGRLDFEKLPWGGWIVRRWWIRLPWMEARTGRGGVGAVQLRMVAIRERGAEVIRISTQGRHASPGEPGGHLLGRLSASSGGRALAQAEVVLPLVGYATVTDSEGRFSLADVPAGVHVATFAHPFLDSAGALAYEREVTVEAGKTTHLEWIAPSRREVLEASCGKDDPEASLIVGRVWTGTAGNPAAGAEVLLESTRDGRGAPTFRMLRTGDAVIAVHTEPGGAVESRTTQITADGSGRFRVCIAGPGARLEVRAGSGGRISPVHTIKVGEAEVLVVELVLEER